MEGLIFLLIIIFIAVNGKGSRDKAAQRRAAGLHDRLTAEMANRRTPARQPAKTRQPITPEAFADIPTVPVETPEPQSSFTVTLPTEGDSFTDDEDCLGGSMGHDHTEGESVAEHRRHVETLLQRENEETLAAQAALDFADMNISRLRQAVVMAEVLDKPKALRRRAV